MRQNKTTDTKLKRVSQKSIRFNEREISAINHYCKKFRITNKSKFMREAIIMEVLKRFEDNHPTLWEDAQLRLF